MESFKHIDTWIFDMDHTLYPKNTEIMSAFETGFSNHISEIYDIPQEEVAEFLTGLREKHGDARTGLIKEMDFDYDAWARSACHIVSSRLQKCQHTIELLEKLPGRKIICTNAGKLAADNILETIGMTHIFEHIDAYRTRGLTAKPQMDVYTNLIAEIKADPKTCAFFEDTAHNLKPAHEMGMTTVLVHGDVEQEDYVSHAYPSLLAFLKEYHAL